MRTAPAGGVQTAAAGGVQTATTDGAQTEAAGWVQTAAAGGLQTTAAGEVRMVVVGNEQQAAETVQPRTTTPTDTTHKRPARGKKRGASKRGASKSMRLGSSASDSELSSDAYEEEMVVQTPKLTQLTPLSFLIFTHLTPLSFHKIYKQHLFVHELYGQCFVCDSDGAPINKYHYTPLHGFNHYDTWQHGCAHRPSKITKEFRLANKISSRYLLILAVRPGSIIP